MDRRVGVIMNILSDLGIGDSGNRRYEITKAILAALDEKPIEYCKCPKPMNISSIEALPHCGKCNMPIKLSEKPAEKEPPFDATCFDAVVWAKEFMRLYKKHLFKDGFHTGWIDEDLMISWFDSAIMAGFDEAKRKQENQKEVVPASKFVKRNNRWYNFQEVDGKFYIDGKLVNFEKLAENESKGRSSFSKAADTKVFQGAEEKYPCVKCGKLRTKEEGGTTFTVCEKCWDEEHSPKQEQNTEIKEILIDTHKEVIESGREQVTPLGDSALVDILELGAQTQKLKAGAFARQKAAQAWCKEKTSSKVMDIDLCEAFAEIIEELTSRAWMGNATTRELLAEISARSDLDYKTVGLREREK